MLSALFKKKQLCDEDVLKLKPGDNHYRAYIGPPRDYDFIAAMVFNLLTCMGLRQEHKVLDIGCGSLRVGRLLIPYLNQANYFGIEPNKWLVEDGVRNEIGQDMVKIKSPTFSYNTSLVDFKDNLNLKYAFAQSIFSHCGIDLISEWLTQLHPHLQSDGALLATVLFNDEDFEGNGWVYPECVEFKMETIANHCGFGFKTLDWPHPRQTWCLFYKDDFNLEDSDIGQITWSNAFKKRYPNL